MNAAKYALCLTPLLLASCVIGNRGTVQVTRNITLGQELSDLKLALDNGSITLSEYQALRAKVFESADHVLGSGEWTEMMSLQTGEHTHDSHDAETQATEAADGEDH